MGEVYLFYVMCLKYTYLFVIVCCFFFLRLVEDFLIRHTAGREDSCVLQCPTPASVVLDRVLWVCLMGV